MTFWCLANWWLTNWHNSSGDGRKKQIKHFWAQHFLSVSLSIWIWALDITICGRLQLFKPAIFFSKCWWHSYAWQRLAYWWLTNWHNSTGDGQKIHWTFLSTTFSCCHTGFKFKLLTTFKPAIFFSKLWWHHDAWQRPC